MLQTFFGDAGENASDGTAAPEGFGELRLGMTRRELQVLLVEWGVREWRRSQGPLGGTLHVLPNRKPYLGFTGFRPVFADGNGIDATGPTAYASPLTTIHLEFTEQDRADLPQFLKALEEKYGAPLRQRQKEASLFDINPMSDEAMGAIFGGRMRQMNAGRVWEWNGADLRLTVFIAVYEKTFLAFLSFERGALSRERAAANAKLEAERRATKELNERNRQAIESLREEQSVKPAKPTRGVIRILDREVEGASVVFALGGVLYLGHPSFEIRDAVRASVESLPDGILFQVVVGGAHADQGGFEVPPGSLLVSSAQTREQALKYLERLLVKKETIPFYEMYRSDYVGIGDIEWSFSRAVRLQPDIICVLTNDPEQRSDWLARVKGALPAITKVRVFLWDFPGDFYYGRSNRVSPTAWQDLARTTGGEIRSVPSRSSSYFWGNGPVVEVWGARYVDKRKDPRNFRHYTGLLRKGRIVYADADDVYVRYVEPGTGVIREERYGRNHISGFRVLQRAREKDVPEAARPYIPEGSLE